MEEPGAVRHVAGPHAPDLHAALLEQRGQGVAEVEGGVVDPAPHHVGPRAHRQPPLHHHPLLALALLGRDLYPRAAARPHGHRPDVDREERARRLDDDPRPLPGPVAGGDVDLDGVPVEGEGAGGGQVGAVPLLLVEARPGPLGVEPAVVEHELGHLAQAQVGEVAGGGPEPLGDQGGVALPAHVEHPPLAARGGSVDQELRGEAEVGSQPGERRGGGDELHVARRVEEDVRVAGVHHLPCVHRLDQDPDPRAGEGGGVHGRAQGGGEPASRSGRRGGEQGQERGQAQGEADGGGTQGGSGRRGGPAGLGCPAGRCTAAALPR